MKTSWNRQEKMMVGVMACLLGLWLLISCSHKKQNEHERVSVNITRQFDTLDIKIGYFADAPRNQYDSAYFYADSLIRLMAPFSNSREYNLLYARSFVRKADLFLFEKRFEEACLYLFMARKSLLSEADSCVYAQLKSTISGRLANISYSQGRYFEAISSHLASLKFLESCGSGFFRFYTIQGTLDNLGLCYSALHQPDSALYFYNKALDFLNKEGPAFPDRRHFIEVAKAVVYGNQGTAWLMKGDTLKAEQAFIRNISINGQKDYAEQDALITRVKLAALYIAGNRFAAADSLLSFIDSSAIPLPAPGQLRILKMKAERENKKGNYRQAHEDLLKYIQGKNALDSANIGLMHANLQQGLDALHQRYEVQAMQRKTELSKAWLFIVLLSLLITSAVLYFTIKSRKAARLHAEESQRHGKQLEMVLEAVEKSNHEYAQLLRVVAHDLKNPLSVIYMLTELMTVQEGKPAEDLEMLQLIRGASTNMNTIIRDLLQSKSQVENNVRRERTDLPLLLRQSVDLLKYRANKKQQRLVVDAGPACAVYVNYEEIWRVINNLLVNAIKFSNEKGLIRVNWDIKDSAVVIQIEDDGIGVPLDMQERIFDQLTQAQRTGTSGEQPFGMGLYISRRIVEAHNGRIWLESTEGKGSIFFVSLPVDTSGIAAT
ncbi:tetratricopeptide repeat-containing sensor histidine kinase [Filimonas effusa]|uniref:histidine kinase n=1 Tax=Filimonas effusa TaxID=2508721 RepID=A0A4Q1D461_9BACT|nr:tetratricopeptide repeat-containing sensor histidine kinase [Filimonas effusa]RXK83210.1 sensor histidine kinase [Filimonas effusa]